MQFLRDGLHGLYFPLLGATFLRQHRSLWKWALLPALINIIILAIACTIMISAYPMLYELATTLIPTDQSERWYAWLWVGPLWLLPWLISALIFVATLAVLIFTFFLVGTVIAAPFLDILTQRVEDITTGKPAADQLTWRLVIQSFSVSIIAELKRLGFFVIVHTTLFILGLVAFLSPLTALMATFFTILFLPLQYAGYAMDHRLMTFQQRRKLLWQQRWLMLGFGTAAFLTLLIPLVNFVCLPILVIGGTLLMLETEHRPLARSSQQT